MLQHWNSSTTGAREILMIERTVGRAGLAGRGRCYAWSQHPLAAYSYELGLPLPTNRKNPIILSLGCIRRLICVSLFCAQSFRYRRPGATRMKTLVGA